jgi:Zn-dependent protease
MLFGWAKPVPVNFRNLKPWRLGMAMVALAGPLTNILLAFIFSRAYAALPFSHALQVCAWAVMLNLNLAVFNMVPIPPLDGSRVVTSVLPIKLAYYYSRLEPFGIFILLILMQFGMFNYLYPVIEQVGSWIGVQI